MFEPVTDTIKDTSETLTKTLTESSIKYNQALDALNNKLLEIVIDRGIVASFLLSLLSKITNPENTSQFKLLEDQDSKRVNDLLIHNTIPVTLYRIFLSFRDTGKEFELKGDLSKLITKKNCNVDLACLLDKKLMYNFAKEKFFDVKAQSNEST